MRSVRLLPVASLILSCGLTTCSTPAKKDYQIVRLGEKVQTGPFSYSAFDTQWLVNLGEGAAARSPQHRFFVVHVNIVNGGRADATVPTISVMDDSGQTFPELSNGEGVPNWLGVVRKIHPAEAEGGNVVFDVEPKHYRLRVADEMEDQVAYIDIPLSFTSDPNIPIPAPPPPAQK